MKRTRTMTMMKTMTMTTTCRTEWCSVLSEHRLEQVLDHPLGLALDQWWDPVLDNQWGLRWERQSDRSSALASAPVWG
jgi:hypothetical protein